MDSLIWLCVCDVVNKLLSTAVVGSREGGTSVCTVVGGAREGSDVEGFGSCDDSDSNVVTSTNSTATSWKGTNQSCYRGTL